MRTEDARTGIRDHLVGTPVDAAILLWAEWTTGRTGWGGSSSPAALLMLAKKIGIAPRGTSVLPDMPAAAAKVDTLVARLERLLARPFKVYYLQYAPPSAKARVCGFGDDVTTLYRHVRRARLVIAAGFEPCKFDIVQRFPIESGHTAATCRRDEPGSRRRVVVFDPAR